MEVVSLRTRRYFHAPMASLPVLQDDLLRLKGVFRDSDEQARYVTDSLPRLQIVLELMADLAPRGVKRVLELGSNPYLLTSLLQRRFDFELELANYFQESLGRARYEHRAELDGRPVTFPYSHFNVETDPFPYSDAQFDCVLFCEIVEHLLLDPSKAMAEIARVTKAGGFVVVSTPNATRLPNLYNLMFGRSIWDGYSPYGPYGRHNREYTLSEVETLLDRAGFDPIHNRVVNLQNLARRFTYLQWIRPKVWNEHLFVVGRRRGSA
jgi:SAM-dependent methyltransferase